MTPLTHTTFFQLGTRTHAGHCQKRKPVNTALLREQIQNWTGGRNESSPL